MLRRISPPRATDQGHALCALNDRDGAKFVRQTMGLPLAASRSGIRRRSWALGPLRPSQKGFLRCLRNQMGLASSFRHTVVLCSTLRRFDFPKLTSLSSIRSFRCDFPNQDLFQHVLAVGSGRRADVEIIPPVRGLQSDCLSTYRLQRTPLVAANLWKVD